MNRPILRHLSGVLTVLFCLFSLVACSGIPLRSIPRLVELQRELLVANPAEFMVAIEVDDRMVPPPRSSPILQIDARPVESGDFEEIKRNLPMRFSSMTTNRLGLEPPPANRRWLIYSLTPSSQAELISIQEFFRHRRGESPGKKGVILSVGIAQEGVAMRNPALASTRWESWLQVSRKEGFFELWSGTVSELLEQAKNAGSSS